MHNSWNITAWTCMWNTAILRPEAPCWVQAAGSTQSSELPGVGQLKRRISDELCHPRFNHSRTLKAFVCLFFTTCSTYKRLSLIVFCNCNWCLVVSADGIPQQRNPQDFLTPRASPSQDEVPQRPTQGSVFREKTTDLKHAGLELLPVPYPKVLPLNQTTAPNLSCLSVVHESDGQQDEWARVCWKTDLDRLVP